VATTLLPAASVSLFGARMVTRAGRNRHHPPTVQAAVAAGHPATVEAGVEILSEGGSAADAAVAASLASCVAETVMTGLLGGGHAIYFDASSGRTRNLDCFVAVPGLGVELRRDAELLELEVPFGAELVHYAVGPASCGVPGLPAGLGVLHREHGRLPWPRLVGPALRLARDGVEFPPAHAACLAMLAPVMTMDAGARIYSPGGRLLLAGERLRQPGLAPALEALAEEGSRSVYEGSLADALLALMEERGGLVTRDDLRAYEARWSEPAEYAFAGTQILARAGLAPVGDTLVRLPTLRGLSPAERAVTLARTLVGPDHYGDTTNLAIVDAEGDICVLTSSLGLGSGDFVPGLDLHLNSMLGESDLVRGTLEPGERMASMMSPLLALDEAGPALAGGAAGGTRLRSALVQVVAGILDEGLAPDEAVSRPRLHPVDGLVNLEPGLGEDVLQALEQLGVEVREWPDRHHYFGGVSVVTRTGAAGDPRRSGSALTLPPR
jgi:gamma-glutamyltranspeptidase / glutathione hydrolase